MNGAQPPLPVSVYGVEFKVQGIFVFSVLITSGYNAVFQELEINFISKALGSVQKYRKKTECKILAILSAVLCNMRVKLWNIFIACFSLLYAYEISVLIIRQTQWELCH